MKTFLGTIILGTILCINFVPQTVSAQSNLTEYQLLEPIPSYIEETSPGKTDAVNYISGFFKLIIAVATGLAVLAIIFGGIKYMSTDAFAGKNEAKATIEHAIWGLLLAISAWLILYTVNPKLVEFDLSIKSQLTPAPFVPPTDGSGGIGGITLTQDQAASAFRAAKVTIVGAINLNGIRQNTVDEVSRLRLTCGCFVGVTSATGGEHAEGVYSHANGYKVDLRSQEQGSVMTTYIISNYQQLPNRDDGARMYRSPTGAVYALEGNHWDVTVR